MATITVSKLIVGLTGNIATGKTAVMNLAAEKGALTIDADKIVHHLMDTDAEMQAAIAIAFGSDVRRPDGRIDRRALGDIVFQDEAAMRDLEEMVHPAVRRIIFRRVQESEASIVFIEAIKLLEGGLADACDQVWVTRCAPKRQLQRLVICRGMDQDSARQRIAAQPPQDEKVARADVVIETGGLMGDTETQFVSAWDRLPDATTIEAKRFDVPESLSSRPLTPSSPSSPSSLSPSPQPTAAAQPRTFTPAPSLPPVDRPDELEVRRARPSDIPSMMLLIHKATEEAVKMKRAEMLMALSERSYFIGQLGTDVKAVVGWNIENLVASVEQIYVYPLDDVTVVGAAIMEEIEASADEHICEVAVVFLQPNTPEVLRQLLADRHYQQADVEQMPQAWQTAIAEHHPAEDVEFAIRVLRER